MKTIVFWHQRGEIIFVFQGKFGRADKGGEAFLQAKEKEKKSESPTRKISHGRWNALSIGRVDHA